MSRPAIAGLLLIALAWSTAPAEVPTARNSAAAVDIGSRRELLVDWKTGSRTRRYTIRIDGFVSLHAPLAGGQMITRPLVFAGQALSINFSTQFTTYGLP
jgi:hypothetical protein